MKILCDSREKWTQGNSKDTHIKDYFEKHGIEYKIEALKAGDYMTDGGRVTVDRKASIEEISGNLTNASDKRRFWNEVRLARELGLHLIVLIEAGKYKAVKDLAPWKSKYSPVRGGALIREMEKLKHAYNVDFVFCSRRSTGKRIVELLALDGKDNP